MLEKLGVGTGVMPICGWTYMQPLPDGTKQRIPATGDAGGDAQLVEQVRMFRINTGIEIGDVDGDVAAYIRRESPINDRFPGRVYESSPEVVQARAGHRPYIERIRDWLRSQVGKRPRLVIEDDADVRAAECIKCPHNVPWKTGCLPCCEAVVSAGQNLRQRPGYKHDKSLGACRLHDFHVSTAVFLDREALPATNPQAPDFCWMHKVA